MNTLFKIKAEPSEETEKEEKEVTDHPSKEEEEEEEKEDKDNLLNNKQLFNQPPNNKLENVLYEIYFSKKFKSLSIYLFI
jgi:hypothetical protein